MLQKTTEPGRSIYSEPEPTTAYGNKLTGFRHPSSKPAYNVDRMADGVVKSERLKAGRPNRRGRGAR